MKLSGIFKNYAKNCAIAILADIDPKGKVHDALKREGWQFIPTKTDEEIRNELLAYSAAGPVCYLPNPVQVITPDGQEVFPKTGRNEDLELRLKQAKHVAAAREYGLN